MTDTPITDMVRKLLEKGVGHDALLIAIEAAEQAINAARPVESRVDGIDPVAEKRRAWDRDRKRKNRSSSTGFHPSPGESRVDAKCASLPIDNITTTSSLEREVPEKPVHRTERGHRLPEDWTPTPQDRLTGDALIGSERFDLELEKFRDHWKQQPGKGGRKLDWNAAWRNWIRRSSDFGGRNGRGANQGRVDTVAGRANTREAGFIAAVARGALRVVGNGGAAGAVRETPEGAGPAEEADTQRDPTWLDFEARGGTR